MNKERFLRLLNERILILDGGMGTMIQSFKLRGTMIYCVSPARM